MNCIFCKIAQGDVSSHMHYQDDQVVAFADIQPQAPVHSIIIPRKHIATLNEITSTEADIVAHMIQTATSLAKTFGLQERGYRLVMNCNADGGQTVFHIHLHLLGGRALSWPPG